MSNGNAQQRDGRNEKKVTWDIMEHLMVFGNRKDNGWIKEANIVAWNNGAPKLDLREWDENHQRMSKGVTLFEDEAEKLVKLLCRRYGIRLHEDEEGGTS